MPLFRYFSAALGVQTLSTCELMVIPPKYLNDVFECSPAVKCGDPLGYTTAQLENVTKSPGWFIKHQKHFPNLTFEQFQKEMRKHARQLAERLVAEIPDIDRELEEVVLELISKKFGVVCFTPDATHPVMWANYGASHRGIVIEFDEQHQLFSGRSFIRVDYSDQRPVFDPSDPNRRDQAEFFLKRKSLYWRYERESRLIVELSLMRTRDTKEGVRYFLPISPELIRSVTLGARAADDSSTLNRVLQELQTERLHHVECFQIERDVGTGRLNRFRVTPRT